MEDFKSVIEFGAVGDGVHDDYAAFQAALDGASKVYIPQGIYCISKTLKVNSNTEILAENSAKIVMKGNERKRRNEFLLTNADTQNGNRNISITGGIWDGNNTSPHNQKPDLFDKNGYSGTVLNFYNVNGLTLKNMVVANSVTYNIRMSRLHNFTIEDISFVSDNFGVNQDGLHFGGDVKHGKVRNIRALSYGQTNDDLIALNADDSIERVENLDLVRDDIEDISFENIYAENCHTIIRILSITAAIRNIAFKNVYGGFRCNAINADAARYCRTPLFKDEDHPIGVGIVENVSIENFTCYPVTDTPADWKGTKAKPKTAILLESNANNFNIKDFRMIKHKGNTVSALKAANIVSHKIIADGTDYFLNEKSDTVTLEGFKDLKVLKI